MAPPFQVRAVNTAPDSENLIHDDRVAAAYGFAGGLVPGVTIYGYMAAAVVAHFGEEWLEQGAMAVRFFQPFYEGEQVALCVAELEPGKIKIEAGTRASGTAWIGETPPQACRFDGPAMNARVTASHETMRAGAILSPLAKTPDLSQPGMSAPLDSWIGERRLVHPAILLSLANEILIGNFALGPWIHSASEVWNASPARDGEPLETHAKIVDTYQRKGHELVVLDVAIRSGERLVSRIRHTAIWHLRQPQ